MGFLCSHLPQFDAWVQQHGQQLSKVRQVDSDVLQFWLV
jgi:hypothetical protein